MKKEEKNIGVYDGKQAYTLLSNEQDEVTMLREMLKMQDVVMVGNQRFMIDSYTGDVRKFMKERLMNILYRFDHPKKNYDTRKYPVSPDEAMMKGKDGDVKVMNNPLYNKEDDSQKT